jgi:hypothetical protein
VAQINLLKQSSTGGDISKNIPKFLIWVFLVILALLLCYYGWLFSESKSMDNKIAAAETKINNDNQTMAAPSSGKDELLTRQQQLQILSGLISGHVYWSQIFKPLADATLKNASYSSLAVGAGQDLTLSVTVPTLEDLDKYMQIFNLPEFNQNFSNVDIGGFSKVQGKNTTSIQFQVKMQYDPKIIQYQAPSNNGG